MKNDTLAVAEDVATKLFAAEEAIDLALSKAADLASFVPLARQQVRVSADVGQEAIITLLASMATLGEARKQMIEVHGALAKAQKDVRLAPRNFGGFVNKPVQYPRVRALSAVPAEEMVA